MIMLTISLSWSLENWDLYLMYFYLENSLYTLHITSLLPISK